MFRKYTCVCVCVCARARARFQKYTKFTSKKKKSEKNNGRERTWREEDVHVGRHCLHGYFGSVKGKSEGEWRLKDNGEF